MEWKGVKVNIFGFKPPKITCVCSVGRRAPSAVAGVGVARVSPSGPQAGADDAEADGAGAAAGDAYNIA